MMGNKNRKVILLNALEKAVRKEINANIYSWPPYCMGLLHQPMRPKLDGKHKNQLLE